MPPFTHLTDFQQRSAFAVIGCLATYGTLWMLCLALSPYLLSRAVGDGWRAGDRTALADWTGALFALGAVLAYVTVAGLLLAVSPLPALVALLGVPLLAVAVGPLRRDSGRLREEGYRVGAVTSWIDALGPGLPDLFLAAVTWLAARMAAQGTISVAELVAVYGYVAVLAVPRVAVLDDGRLTGLGTHDELVARGGAYASLWRSWHGGEPPTRVPYPRLPGDQADSITL